MTIDVKYGHFKRLIILTMITLSGFRCSYNKGISSSLHFLNVKEKKNNSIFKLIKSNLRKWRIFQHLKYSARRLIG